jgi:hypothetical protein
MLAIVLTGFSMSVDQRKTVDFIGTRKADGHVILTISDHLPFDGDEARLVRLQDKLNDYLACIESGEIYEIYPAAKEALIEIVIVFKHPPDDRGVAFLRHAQQITAEAGVGLSYEIFDEPSIKKE